MTRKNVIANLGALIKKRRGRNEIECGTVLGEANAASVLLAGGEQMLFVDAELRTSSGDVDLLICAEESVAGGQNCRCVYVWELKAPQLFLFRVETQGRAAPTEDLWKAENQLLHYHSYVAGSQQNRNNFRVLSPNHVRLGGIIIGTNRTFVKRSKEVSPKKARRLAETARDIRQQIFYRPVGIRLLTWDIVTDLLRGESHRKFEQSEPARIPLTEGPAIEEPEHRT